MRKYLYNIPFYGRFEEDRLRRAEKMAGEDGQNRGGAEHRKTKQAKNQPQKSFCYYNAYIFICFWRRNGGGFYI